jgi:diguanylate cyclase (GGDEF)-like protein
MSRPSLAKCLRLPPLTLALTGACTVAALWALADPARRAAGLPAICFAAAAIFAVFGLIRMWRTMRVVHADLRALHETAKRMRGATLMVESPECRLAETQALGSLFEELAGALTEREEALSEAAHTDNVTGLPSRAYFFRQLRHAFELARRGNEICLLLVEVEGLGKATELLGDEAGERLLKLLAGTLRTQTRKSDFAARLGMNSFAVVYYNAQLAPLHARLPELVSDYRARQEAAPEAGHRAHCTLALGLTAVEPRADQRMEDVFLRAQQALRAARAGGAQEPRIVLKLAAKAA